MKGLWIRVEAHAVDSVVVAQLAESLSIEPVLALGHLTALGGAVAEHTEDGHIADIPNTTLEGWARWKGKRGDFARATREVLQDGDGRLIDWLETMGKLVERREKDRLRKEEERRRQKESSDGGPRTGRGLSTDNPGTGRGVAGATVRDGTERDDVRKTTTRQGRDAARAGEPTFDGVMALVRQRLYVPDGLPPDDWDEARDGSILKELRKTYSYEDISVAVAGLALVRDEPGRFADAVDWLAPRTKVTLRALHNSSSGVLPMFNLATMAYWKHANIIVDGER